AGYRCLLATTAAQAIELADSGQPFEAAVIDAEIGDGGGVELGLRLKRRSGGSAGFLPVLLVADRDGVEERVRSFSAGCDGFLAKPVSILELDARLGALLARRAQHAELARAAETLRVAQQKKRELAALVVHDLRNPLSALRGHLELLEHELGTLSE